MRNACEAYLTQADKKQVLCLSLIMRPQQQGLAITLEDNGPGIDVAHRGQIFTPHFTTKPQAAPSGELPNELPNGLPNGLGLSNAVELAQGTEIRRSVSFVCSPMLGSSNIYIEPTKLLPNEVAKLMR